MTITAKTTCKNCGRLNAYTGKPHELRCGELTCRTDISDTVRDALRKRLKNQLAELAREAEWADRGDHVAKTACAKIIRRHNDTADELQRVRDYILYDCIPAA